MCLPYSLRTELYPVFLEVPETPLPPHPYFPSRVITLKFAFNTFLVLFIDLGAMSVSVPVFYTLRFAAFPPDRDGVVCCMCSVQPSAARCSHLV